MSCSEEKLSKHLTQTFMAHCNAIVTLSGYAESPKVADAVIEAQSAIIRFLTYQREKIIAACNK
jgi:hypothetical protein